MAYGNLNVDTVTTSTAGGVLGAGNASIMKNRLIDAGFTINQRGYVSGTALSAGVYAHDRFKAGASGCTYTFTQGSAGVPIVITITAGSLQQVIEGCNMPDGGAFTLSWTGTAQARFNGGTYGSSPLAVTGITAGANTTIEFNTGTVSFPQLEVGSSATGYEYRQYGQELALCQRYFYGLSGNASNSMSVMTGQAIGAGSVIGCFIMPTQMRSTPSLSYNSVTTWTAGGSSSGASTWSIDAGSNSQFLRVSASGGSGLTAGNASGMILNNATSYFNLSAEL